MPVTHLRIDTSIVSSDPSSSRGGLRAPRTPRTPSSARSASGSGRLLRSPSSTSVSSTLSMTSRAPSSSSHLSIGSANPTTPISATSNHSGAWPTIDSGSEDESADAGQFVLAMHDFAPQQPNANCLSFRAGQVIRVLNRDASGWWDGQLDGGRRGWFPSNYVTSEVGLLTEEELPGGKKARPGHNHSMSVSSATSWTSTSSRKGQATFSRNNHRPTATDPFAGTIDMYCPPLMLPLLRALSLLQNAVRTNRVHHFQPATACIISCVRALLSEIGCLSRDAKALKEHGVLAQERKRILADLASLVSLAKRASDETVIEEIRDVGVRSMVRLAGQLFAHVRGFLAVGVQCGLELPANGHRSVRSDSHSSRLSDDWNGSSDPDSAMQDDVGGDDFATPGRSTKGSVTCTKRMPTANTPSRPKSFGDLKASKKFAMGADYPPMPTGPLRAIQRKMSEQQLTSPTRPTYSSATTPRHHKPAQLSVSSTSSSSSLSSDSVGTPATPVFPSGPATTQELLDALRFTHDSFLSTIAAFIGHAHSHSRHSHASSTGHMYDLVREIVDVVCRLLTVVEAVLKHPDIPPAKTGSLRAAKEGLYNVTSTLADSVRALTGPPPEGVSEEAEKEGLLNCATDALRAGSDLSNAVKKCLQRTSGERPLVFNLPSPGDPEGGMYTPRKFSHAQRNSTTSARSVPRIRKAESVHELHEPYVDAEEDMTIQAQAVDDADHTMTVKRQSQEAITVVPPSPTPQHREEEEEILPTPITPATPDVLAENKPLPDVRPSLDSVAFRSDAASLNSYAPTEDDRTTWEGSHRTAPSTVTFEEKLLNGELPAIPGSSHFASAVLPWTFPHDHSPEDVAYNSDGQLVGATLEALVERMTPHDVLVEPPFAAVFFMTFRLFTTPVELLEAVISRYNILPPPGLNDTELRLWQQRKGLPVRLRVSNFIKTWVETYWRHSTDADAVPLLLSFITDALGSMFPGPSQRILELVRQRIAAGGVGGLSPKPRDAGIPLNPPTLSGPISEVPRPIMTKSVLSALRARNYSAVAAPDFDPLELARQLTVMECTLYCAIRSEEVLETGSKAGSNVSVKAVTSLSTAITGWVAESILNEPDTKKRTALVKYFIKLADRCVSLRNYSTPRSILAALDSSTIARLHQTWNGLPQKHKIALESLRKLADHARNYHEYRSRLRNTAPPAVPFLGLYLTDITFCREGNPSYRTSPKAPEKKLINFNKYHKIARIVQDMQRFQVPYNLKEIPEVQTYLRDAFDKSQGQGDLQDLYRRSLLVEPKQSAEAPPSSDVRQLFAWASRSQQSAPPASAT